jgi:hypothetical protein
MSDLYISIGKLEERLSAVPSGAKMFWSAFGGAGAIATIVLAIVTVWLPREFDGIKTDAAKNFVEQKTSLDRIAADIGKLGAAVEIANDGLQSLSSNVATIGLSQRAQGARFLPMQQFVDTLSSKDILRFSAYKGDTNAMVETISALPPRDRDKLFSIMAVSILADALNSTLRKQP